VTPRSINARPFLRPAALLAAALLLLTTGCLDVDNQAQIGATGGGTFTESVTVDLAKLTLARRQLKERTSGLGEDEDARPIDPFGVLDPKVRLEELGATEGISDVVTTRSAAKEGTRRYVLKGTFASLEALYEGGFIDDAEAALWSVREGKAWQLEARSLGDDEELEPAARKTLLDFRRKLLEPYRASLGALVIRRTLVFPTRVLQHDGTLADDGRTVTWTIRFDDLADPRSLRQRVVFAADAKLKLEPFGRKPAGAAAPQGAPPRARDK